jgi:hypothetical protein
MPRHYVTLAGHPFDMVRLACTKCERRGQYRKSTLIERYGPDKNMVDLRLELAADCPKIAAWQKVNASALLPRMLTVAMGRCEILHTRFLPQLVCWRK